MASTTPAALPRTFADARGWMQQGTTLFFEAVEGLTEADYDAPSLLPGWTRRHVVAHVAANGDALGNLVHWAASGEVTPMYASPEDRAAGIERGTAMSATELTSWFRHSSTALESAMSWLTDRQWQAPVVTAQRRTVPATEIPWLRAREIFVHAVDLDRGIGFGDLLDDFTRALYDDIRTKRGMHDLPEAVASAPIADITAWLAGRPHTIVGAPELDRWL